MSQWKKIGKNIIYCIGDSHVSLFNGINKISKGGEFPSTRDSHPNFKTYNIGPAIAYNLVDKNHHWNKSVKKILPTIPKNCTILFSFGQIDCSNHLPKQKKVQSNRIYDDIIKECVDRYFSFITEIKNIGYKVIPYGPIVPTKAEVALYNFKDKIHAVKLFTKYLCQLCSKNNVECVPMYKKLLDKDDNVITEFYMDTVHLSTKILNDVINDLLDKHILVWN